jgi:hypothetical protein
LELQSRHVLLAELRDEGLRRRHLVRFRVRVRARVRVRGWAGVGVGVRVRVRVRVRRHLDPPVR